MRYSNLQWIGIASGALLVLGVLKISGSFKKIQGGIQRVAMPVARLFSGFGIAGEKSLAVSPRSEDLQASVRELEARLASMSVDYVRLRSLEEENRSLHTLIGFMDESGYDSVVARVISRTRDPHRALIMIDRGSRDGLETGMAVVFGRGIFVGKITSLEEDVATVTLLTDEQSRTAAAFPGQHRLIGLVEGEGGSVARLTFVAQQDALHQKDIIVTAGTEEKIPPNLVIGMVDRIEGKASDSFQQAALTPLSTGERLDIVAVLRSAALRPHSP